ncbi:MAG: hypothetical protein ACHP9T_04435 [Caulobacterales bacterium]|jgi:hypothetical protein
MRQFLALAATFSLAAGVVHAQIRPIPGMPVLPTIGSPKPPRAFTPYAPPKPYQPPAATNVYGEGPFSPAAEARRERKAGRAPVGGPFSPEAEAKRERERAKGFQPF